MKEKNRVGNRRYRRKILAASKQACGANKKDTAGYFRPDDASVLVNQENA